jgi:heme-degrading monooxygenase HmoA
MFVRKVSVRVKSNTVNEFAALMESEVVPWLRTQEGFLHLLTLAASDGCEFQVLSFWDHEANAQAYADGAYPTAVKILGRLLDGIPYVRIFEVVGSTLRELASLQPEDAISADVHALSVSRSEKSGRPDGTGCR